MTALPQNIPDSGSPVPITNENFGSLSPFFCYANNPLINDLLHRGYSGGRWGGFDVPDYDHTFGASTTTYVSAKVSDGTLNFSTSNTNFNDATNYKRVETVVTSSTAITTVADYRAGPGGAHGSGGGGGGGGAWGGITGTLSDQTDLQAALDAKAQDRRTTSALTVSAGVVNIDCALGDYFTLAPTANVTSITFSNLPGSGKGASLWIKFTQDTTPRTVAWPASFKWEGGVAGAVSTGSGVKDDIAITTVDNGTTWDITLSKARA